LVAAGVSDDEARDQIVERFNVSNRSARKWLDIAYREMAAEADVDRRQLVGTALRRRRLVMARAAKDGDWKTYLAAADSESKLLGLNAPVQTEHHVLIDKVQDMSKAMIDVVKDYFADDEIGRQRFVSMLRARVNAQLAARPDKSAIVIDVESEEVARIAGGSDEPVEASDARLAPSADVAPTAAPSPDAPPLA
jgi:hypothetical protein